MTVRKGSFLGLCLEIIRKAPLIVRKGEETFRKASLMVCGTFKDKTISMLTKCVKMLTKFVKCSQNVLLKKRFLAITL